ncbi:hypothetical protein [Paraglaciecola sp. 2405UD69-4]|uniref:hypothetical protein n=1 Tax=Paraglaciecola sp. 2405UD69-4 TaxID=3391836 RepID=UPI0039C9F54E
MDMLIFSVALVLLCILVFFIRRLTFEPKRVFTLYGETVHIRKNPHKLNRHFLNSHPLVVQKASISQIQMTGDIVTLFNQASNATDICAPNSKLASEVFEYAKKHFEQAKIIEVTK